MFGHTRRIILKAIVAIALVFFCWVENTIQSIVSTVHDGGICGIRLILLFGICIGIYQSFFKLFKQQSFSRADARHHAGIVISSTNDGRNSNNNYDDDDEESGKTNQAAKKQKLRWSEKVRVRVVRNLNKYTMEEKSECWYSKNEYREMDRERQHQRATQGSLEREFSTSLYSNMI